MIWLPQPLRVVCFLAMDGWMDGLRRSGRGTFVPLPHPYIHVHSQMGALILPVHAKTVRVVS